MPYTISLTTKELISATALAATMVYVIKRLSQTPSPPLPPGPKWFPVIGHLLSMPRASEHVAYAKMSEEVGSDIIALSVLGQTIVVLNSAKAASELLDKRSSIYSGRAQIPAITDKDLLDWGAGIVFINNNDRWRRDRRMLHESLHKGVVPQYHDGQTKQIRAFLNQILDTSPSFETFYDELYFALGSGIMYAIYGYIPQSKDDEWLKAAHAATNHTAQAAQPTENADRRLNLAFMVNFIPALKHLPDWVPGTSWKRILNEWREHKEYITSAPYTWAKEQLREGRGVPSIVQKILAQFPDNTPEAEDDLHIRLMTATLIAGGTDTTSASTMMFLLAMLRHPEVAKRLQAELDSVLGNAERLPSVEDCERMPYVRNTILELLRWQPVTPLAVPHAAMESDLYRGYHIPEGAIVMGNTWAITRDESVYPDPECFNPDRFLDPAVPPAPAFGYGRRICPGLHFAEANLFLIISSLMYIFDIRRTVDKNGKEIVPEIDINLGQTLVSKPKPFKFSMKPRSDAHRRLVLGGI
ncbi:hypothetical protein FRC06_005458 [Ceratobasidium sp. 370]|nr:hypothetical protein FRC06_005458 [Ceratobasidium sp. 370]